MEKIEETIITYKGNCPSCKAEQIGKRASDVDKPCYKCKKEILTQEFRKEHEFLIGSVITEFEIENDEIGEITIKSKDGKVHTIYPHPLSDDDAYLEIT